jgi:Cupin domain
MAKARMKAGSSASRTRRQSPAKRRATPGAKLKAWPPQEFTVSHHRDEDFRTNGLRNYAKYRDLGLSRATHGLVQAHVIRFVPPCRPEEVSKRHYHEVDLQMIYVLQGWIKTELEGPGAILMNAGSCWIQPNRIEHSVLDYSDDCEVLEIVLPADFKTVELQ